MSIIATQPEQKERELVPAGTHPAYLYRVIYLGTHKKTFEGKETQSQKIWIDFELPKQVVEYEDKETKEKKSFVRTIGAEYTLSLSEKGKLLPLIQGWLGRSLTLEEVQGFDVCSLLGKPAFLTVSHNTAKSGKEYANIASVAPVMDGFQMPVPVNKTVEIGKAEWDGEEYKKLPDFLKEKINESNEKTVANTLGGKVVDDEIPVIDTDKDMTMHQGDNQADSNGAKLEEAPF